MVANKIESLMELQKMIVKRLDADIAELHRIQNQVIKEVEENDRRSK